MAPGKAVDEKADETVLQAVELAYKETDETVVLQKAVEFAYKYSRQGRECPFCSKQFFYREEPDSPDPQAMHLHLQQQHTVRCLVCYEKEDITADIRREDPDLDDILQLRTQDDFEHYNMLHIDPQVVADIRKNGDVPRWAHPAKVAQWKARGAQLVTVGEGKEPITATTAADGTARANEMVLMRIPAAVAQGIRARREAKVHQASDNKDDLQLMAEATEKSIYEALVKQGRDSTVALQVAKARAGFLRRQADGEMRGDWKSGNPSARNQLRVWRGEHG